MSFSGPVILILAAAGLATAGAWPSESRPAVPKPVAAPSQPAVQAAKSAVDTPVTPAASVPDPKLAAKVGLSVYPAKGQSQPQQVKDEQECYQWAGEQTGVDPAAAVNTDSAGKAAKAKTDSATTGAAVAGAARGAAGGAVVGGIVGDAGTGAAVGAVAGAAKGRKARKTASAQAEQQGQQQASAQGAATLDKFSKAMASCLQGRGYTVN